MTRRPIDPKQLAGVIRAMKALYHAPPMSDDERAAFKQQLADRRARDERDRAAEPDLFVGDRAK